MLALSQLLAHRYRALPLLARFLLCLLQLLLDLQERVLRALFMLDQLAAVCLELCDLFREELCAVLVGSSVLFNINLHFVNIAHVFPFKCSDSSE